MLKEGRFLVEGRNPALTFPHLPPLSLSSKTTEEQQTLKDNLLVRLLTNTYIHPLNPTFICGMKLTGGPSGHLGNNMTKLMWIKWPKHRQTLTCFLTIKPVRARVLVETAVNSYIARKQASFLVHFNSLTRFFTQHLNFSALWEKGNKKRD